MMKKLVAVGLVVVVGVGASVWWKSAYASVAATVEEEPVLIAGEMEIEPGVVGEFVLFLSPPAIPSSGANSVVRYLSISYTVTSKAWPTCLGRSFRMPAMSAFGSEATTRASWGPLAEDMLPEGSGLGSRMIDIRVRPMAGKLWGDVTTADDLLVEFVAE